MIIAITGYLGAGKSTAAEVFREDGFKVIDVDNLGHELLKNPRVKEELTIEFGMRILGKDLEIGRDKLSKHVFADVQNLETLNKIVHPHLKEALQKRVRDSTENVVIDVALFNELGINMLAHKVILVSTHVLNISERMKDRYDETEICNIINSQSIPKRSDYCVENNGTKDDLRRRVRKICSKIK